MRTREIVVGTDGTAAGGAAVRWAAREASRRHVLLRIVHAFDGDRQSARYDSGHENIDVGRQVADAVAACAVREAGNVSRSMTIEVDTLIGDPVARLLDVGA